MKCLTISSLTTIHLLTIAILLVSGTTTTIIFSSCGGNSVRSDLKNTLTPFASPAPISPSPTSTAPVSTGNGLTGNYGAQLTLTDDRFAVVTLAVKDMAGTTTGGVYIYKETVPNTKSRSLGRHEGHHPIIASGNIAGQVNPESRSINLTGTVTSTDGNNITTPVSVTGRLQKIGTAKGSITLQIGSETASNTFP